MNDKFIAIILCHSIANWKLSENQNDNDNDAYETKHHISENETTKIIVIVIIKLNANAVWVDKRIYYVKAKNIRFLGY